MPNKYQLQKLETHLIERTYTILESPCTPFEEASSASLHALLAAAVHQQRTRESVINDYERFANRDKPRRMFSTTGTRARFQRSAVFPVTGCQRRPIVSTLINEDATLKTVSDLETGLTLDVAATNSRIDVYEATATFPKGDISQMAFINCPGRYFETRSWSLDTAFSSLRYGDREI